MASEQHSWPVLLAFFLSEPSDEDFDLLESLVPPSDRAGSHLLADPQQAWKQLVEPEGDEQCFAAVLQGNRAAIMMKGIPTEDAWDAFRETLG